MSTQPENSPDNGAFWGSLSCVLTIIAWLVVILTWSWVFTRPRGTFHDMGAMTLTFVVLPLSFVAWFVGGPVALSLGGRAMKNPSNSETAASERRIARVGIFLSRLLLWGGVAFIALTILSNMFA